MAGRKSAQEKTANAAGAKDPKSAEAQKPDVKAAPKQDQAASPQQPQTPQPADPMKLAAELEQRRAEAAKLNALLVQRSQEIDSLRSSIERLQKDFDTYRNNAGKDREDYASRKVGETMQRFMAVADNIDTALRTFDPKKTTPEKFSKGLEIMANMFADSLSKAGISEISALNKPFDTNFHEAVGRVESDKLPEGTVASVERKGYMYNGRVLRPACVVVTIKKQ